MSYDFFALPQGKNGKKVESPSYFMSPIYRTRSYMRHIVMLNGPVSPEHTRDCFHTFFSSASRLTHSDSESTVRFFFSFLFFK